MPTWEDLLEGYVGLAKQFLCSTCLNQIFRGSTGHWGQKLVLNKVAPPGGVKDDQGHQIAFQCQDCTGKEPIVYPVIHPNGEVVDHFNISELQNSQDKEEITRITGDYDNRPEMKKINDQYQLTKEEEKEVEEEIAKEQVERVENDPKLEKAEEDIDKQRAEWAKKEGEKNGNK
jgi:hypothetical protein